MSSSYVFQVGNILLDGDGLSRSQFGSDPPLDFYVPTNESHAWNIQDSNSLIEAYLNTILHRFYFICDTEFNGTNTFNGPTVFNNTVTFLQAPTIDYINELHTTDNAFVSEATDTGSWLIQRNTLKIHQDTPTNLAAMLYAQVPTGLVAGGIIQLHSFSDLTELKSMTSGGMLSMTDGKQTFNAIYSEMTPVGGHYEAKLIKIATTPPPTPVWDYPSSPATYPIGNLVTFYNKPFVGLMWRESTQRIEDGFFTKESEGQDINPVLYVDRAFGNATAYSYLLHGDSGTFKIGFLDDPWNTGNLVTTVKAIVGQFRSILANDHIQVGTTDVNPLGISFNGDPLLDSKQQYIDSKWIPPNLTLQSLTFINGGQWQGSGGITVTNAPVQITSTSSTNSTLISESVVSTTQVQANSVITPNLYTSGPLLTLDAGGGSGTATLDSTGTFTVYRLVILDDKTPLVAPIIETKLIQNYGSNPITFQNGSYQIQFTTDGKWYLGPHNYWSDAGGIHVSDALLHRSRIPGKTLSPSELAINSGPTLNDLGISYEGTDDAGAPVLNKTFRIRMAQYVNDSNKWKRATDMYTSTGWKQLTLLG